MLTIEKELWKKGYQYIVCIDEVGRGCLLGDVVACAVVMPKDLLIEGVRDSKKLSEKKRLAFNEIIREKALAVGIGQVKPSIIDQINIKKSTHLAMKEAIMNLKDGDGNKINPDFVLIDAEKLDIDLPQLSIIKGDDKCHGIACASIVAKVYRDNLCLQWGKDYPDYKIEKHKGYGTKEHREAIKKFGATPLHRISFLIPNLIDFKGSKLSFNMYFL